MFYFVGLMILLKYHIDDPILIHERDGSVNTREAGQHTWYADTTGHWTPRHGWHYTSKGTLLFLVYNTQTIGWQMWSSHSHSHSHSQSLCFGKCRIYMCITKPTWLLCDHSLLLFSLKYIFCFSHLKFCSSPLWTLMSPCFSLSLQRSSSNSLNRMRCMKCPCSWETMIKWVIQIPVRDQCDCSL